MRLSLKNIYYKNSTELVKENYNIIKRDSFFILEKKSTNAGDKYEQAIRSLFLKTKVAGPLSKSKKNARNRWASDADINIYGELLNIEIKATPSALLGSLSIKFDGKNGFQGFTTEDALEPEFYDLLSQIVKKNDKKIKQLISFIHEKDPDTVPKFPMVMWKDLYDANGPGITQLYITGKFPMSVVHDLYASKNVYYMQIGGRGLYSLKQNYNFMPDDLPQLDGTIEFQIRPKPGTGEKGGRKTAKITLSIDFKFNIPSGLSKSPYTIDSAEGIQHLMSSIENKKTKKVA